MKNLKYISGTLATIFLFAVMSLAGCTEDDDKGDNGGTTNPNPQSNQVVIRDNSFSPGTIEVTAGTTVRWTNNDGTPHTVTSDTGVFDSGTIGNGGTYSYRFTTPGTYPYFCQLHAGMTGTVIVN